jgi:hypothetical protein
MAGSKGKSVAGSAGSGLGVVSRAGTRVPPQVSRPASRAPTANPMEASLKGWAKESTVKRSPSNPTQPLPGKANTFVGKAALTLAAKPAGSPAGLTEGSTRRTVSGVKSPLLYSGKSPSPNPKTPGGPLPTPSSALPLDEAAILGRTPVLTPPLAMMTSGQVAGRVLTSFRTGEGAMDASEGGGGAPATDGSRDQTGSLSVQSEEGVAENDVTVKDHDSVGMDESESRARVDEVNGESVRPEQPSLRPAEERGGGGLGTREEENLGRGFAPNPAGSVPGTAGFRDSERKKPVLTVDVSEPVADRDGAALSGRREREGVEDGDGQSPILDPKARLARMREYGRQQVRNYRPRWKFT